MCNYKNKHSSIGIGVGYPLKSYTFYVTGLGLQPHQRARLTVMKDIRFVLGTAPSHASIPPKQNATMAKGR